MDGAPRALNFPKEVRRRSEPCSGVFRAVVVVVVYLVFQVCSDLTHLEALGGFTKTARNSFS